MMAIQLKHNIATELRNNVQIQQYHETVNVNMI